MVCFAIGCSGNGEFWHNNQRFETFPADDQTGHQELFCGDCSQPDAADGEPVFWPAGAAQAFPTDDSVQPDAPE